MPHRTRIRQGIIETWQGWFTELKKLLKVSLNWYISQYYICLLMWIMWSIPQSAVGALSFTTDIWSNKRRQSYLCITVHWVAYNKPNNQGLILKSSLLAFHPLHGKHSGKAIAEVIYSLLERADVTGEVCIMSDSWNWYSLFTYWIDNYVSTDTGLWITHQTMVLFWNLLKKFMVVVGLRSPLTLKTLESAAFLILSIFVRSIPSRLSMAISMIRKKRKKIPTPIPSQMNQTMRATPSSPSPLISLEKLDRWLGQ